MKKLNLLCAGLLIAAFSASTVLASNITVKAVATSNGVPLPTAVTNQAGMLAYKMPGGSTNKSTTFLKIDKPIAIPSGAKSMTYDIANAQDDSSSDMFVVDSSCQKQPVDDLTKDIIITLKVSPPGGGFAYKVSCSYSQS